MPKRKKNVFTKNFRHNFQNFPPFLFTNVMDWDADWYKCDLKDVKSCFIYLYITIYIYVYIYIYSTNFEEIKFKVQNLFYVLYFL